MQYYDFQIAWHGTTAKVNGTSGIIMAFQNMYNNKHLSHLSRSHAMWQLLLYLSTHGGIVERLKRVLSVRSSKG